MPKTFALPFVIYFSTCAAALSANAPCIDLKQTSTLSFEGTLSYSIFAGPPNYEDVRKGDSPEPTYILKLDAPICATGDEFLNPSERFDKIQVYPADSGTTGRFLSRDLRRLVGKRVVVEGSSAFGAHTGHHHAPATGRCNGEAVVRTIKRDGLNLIDSIKATSDC